MANRRLALTPARGQLIALLLAAVALYAVIPQIGSFRHSLSLLPHARWRDLEAAILFTGLSYAAAAGTYTFLAVKPLWYARTLLVQVAGMFVNRLLPAGIGGISVNYLYLRRNKHSAAQAASVVAANNATGIVGNVLLVLALLPIAGDDLPPLQLWHIGNTKLILAIAAVSLAAWLIFYRFYRRQLLAGLRKFIGQFLAYRHRPGHLAGALACSLSLTLANVLSFWLCVSAMHITLPFLAALIIFSFGVALGTATPTPGGLGGVEAGMVAGLAVYHVEGATALAAVLLYRLISYWLPLIAGGAAFFYAQRRGYFTR